MTYVQQASNCTCAVLSFSILQLLKSPPLCIWIRECCIVVKASYPQTSHKKNPRIHQLNHIYCKTTFPPLTIYKDYYLLLIADHNQILREGQILSWATKMLLK